MSKFNRLTSNPNIPNGEPAIRCARLPVSRVIEALAIHRDWDELRREYLGL